jgi:hypothetical protein
MNFITKDWTQGQLNALVKIIGEENAKKIINGTAKFQITEEQFLQSLGVITLDPIKVEKDKFFVTGKNGTTKLLLSYNFKNIFLPLVADTIDYKGGKLEKLKLTKGCNDGQIKKERGDILIQKPDDIASQIASLTSKQPKGEEGDLLSNDYANIFYFEKDGSLFYVFVRWDSDGREWDCYCRQARSSAWAADVQVLSPVTLD